jgi:uncharacterized protein (UPF0333 family)
MIKEQKAQGSTETLLALGLAVVAAVTVGFFIKNYVTEKIAPEVEEKID